ncbi:carboxymuconolactone decarboxylase family protein [Rhizobium laguerreae]|uniref:carboxymuconolactone decarboxylase family protein n=1 Tax=Rhizobium laguerreae TaxID=1076926 RepID=UPI0014429B01|nr:carboxymuconolactone decarboxylase family protein [Rhizobium laguerreae]MBY3155827.1 carboxymuconolactone decarboxylase family protein [Rhizobium laguerreae]MBY3191646.1 carboxymuconolactone decarboxylase family protein [Rhizobium laguerreae]MBY3446695.1 carboxymuconolactone decarboxylase family protein [Rhizobium laguerreae]NKN10490.1 carboxymuconolactone decarboxylase family protein [Rhizobium laguerreae]
MIKRLNFMAHRNSGIDSLVAVEGWIAKSFDPKLLELVKVRVSQMNGCAHCLHMHRQDALKLGETDDRLLLLNAWRESQLFSTRERAALAWAEALTQIAKNHAPDDVYEEAQANFSDDELVALSIGIAMINAWNRLAIGFRLQHPADHKRVAA